MASVFNLKSPLSWMLIFVPAAIALKLTHADPLYVFVASAAGIIPLAGWMGRATEWMTEHLGSGIGRLLNATFGNAAELIIAIMALRAGLHEVVKASITGSIIGNILLVLGVALLTGGIRFSILKFNRTAASLSTTLLALSAIALIVPALFHRLAGAAGARLERTLSLEISIVLAITYVLSLVFALYTHKHLYVGETDADCDDALGFTHVPIGVAAVILLVSTGLVAVLVAPVLVFVSYAFGRPLDLLFTTFEIAAITLSIIVVHFIAADGESNWMEGVLLIAVYAIFGLAFYTLPM